ncbi:hypothetical protein ACFXTN_027743 [Malus domestica]
MKLVLVEASTSVLGREEAVLQREEETMRKGTLSSIWPRPSANAIQVRDNGPGDEGCEVMVLTPDQMMTLHALIEPSLNRDHQTIKHRIKLIGTGNIYQSQLIEGFLEDFFHMMHKRWELLSLKLSRFDT